MPAQGRRYLFTGGGTGGHVTPNLAVLTELRNLEPDALFLYAGSPRGYETRVVESGIPFRPVPCAPFCSPRRVFRFGLMLLRIAAGIAVALGVVLRFRPHVVVATGGYVSVPVVLASWILRRRIYLHEQNVHPGLANRLLALFATRVGVSFRETVARFPKGKAVHTGYPVRRQILEGSPERARARFDIPADARVAFILGGSMGARSINRGTVEALHTLLRHDHICVIHSTGLSTSAEYRAFEDTQARLQRAGFSPRIPGRYVCEPFFNDIQDVYALADLVVARAGAGTVMELATVGKPSILIPKSDAPGDHQLLNALSLQKTGSAEVLFEEKGEEAGVPLTRVRGDALARKIADLLDHADELEKMGRRASRLAVADALAVNTALVRRLASDEPLLDTVTETARVGYLLDAQGRSHELLFRANIVGTGLFADVKIARGDGGPARAVVLRSRRGDLTEFHLVPRQGRVEVGGQPAQGRHRLALEDQISIGGQRFTFTVEDRTVERQVDSGGMGLRVAVTGAGTFASRICGFAREAVAGAVFGLGNITDITSVGLSVANFFRGVFAENAVDSAFLPTFIHLHRTGRRDAANRLFSSLLTLTVILSGAVTAAAVLTMPFWLGAVAPGFAARGILGDAVLVTRIMFPYLVLVSIAALLSAVLKACNRFAVPAFSSVMFTAGVLAGTLAYPWFGMAGLGAGVLLGGLGQILIQIPSLRSPEVRGGFGLAFRPLVDLRDPGVRKVGRVTPNILADTSIQKLANVVDKTLATPLGAGAASVLYYGMVVFQLPFGLISQSINTVVLKELSEGQALKDRDFTRRLLAGGINWTVFTLLPVAVAMVVLSEPIVRLLFQYGSFSEAAVLEVALCLRWYAAGLLGWGLTGLAGRFFAARMEQNTNTLTSLAGLALNLAVSISLVRAGAGVAGIAIGTSAAFLGTAALRLAILARVLREEGIEIRRADVVPSLCQTAIATGGALLAALVVLPAVNGFDALPAALNRAFVLGVPATFGAFAFLATALLVRSEQLEEILLRLGRKRTPPGVPVEPQPVNPYCIDPPGRLLDWVKANPSVRHAYNFARRVTTFLNSKDWRTRNVGVKLVGELGLKSFRYDLCAILANREAAPRSHRVLGGDFAQPGFLRRNAIVALERLGDSDPQAERALLDALADPYYEVRAEAARALGVLAGKLSGAGREEAAVRLQSRLGERNFEVLMEVVTALGSVSEDARVVDHLRALHYHRNWQVRDRVVLAYGALHARGVVPDRTRVLALLDDVLTTSDGFTPRFILREHLADLQSRLLGAAVAPERRLTRDGSPMPESHPKEKEAGA